jgi:putative membrane protein
MSRTTAMLAVALAGTLAATGALAQSKPVDKASQKFISSAIQGDIAEVDFGKLAQEKGQSDAVKQYGAMLVKDHGDHKTKAEQVASELGVTPPTGSGIGAKATYAKLKILSGASFDRSFAKSMVKDHKRTSRNIGRRRPRPMRPAVWPKRRCRSCRNICRRHKRWRRRLRRNSLRVEEGRRINFSRSG